MNPVTGTDEAVQQAGMQALRRLLLAGEQLRQAVAAHFGIGLTETVAMSHLSQHGGLTPRELADHVGLTPSAITTVLDRLERAGLAQRSPHPSDRRKVLVALTAHGQELLEAAQGWLIEALAQLDESEQRTATDILTRLASALEARTAALRARPPGGAP